LPRDQLGLFDTPPERRQVRLCIVLVGVLALPAMLVLPVRDAPLGQVSAFIPTVDAFIFLADVITAALLCAQAAVFRSRALAILAAGYVFSAALLIPHALTFPGAFAPDGLLGAGVNTTGWIANFRRLSFPIAIVLYVWFRRSNTPHGEIELPPVGIFPILLLAAGLAAAMTLLATLGHDLLPSFYANRSHLAVSYTTRVETVNLAVFAAATILLYRARTSVLDMWLLVALSGWLIQSLLIMTLSARFTAGWYALYAIAVSCHLTVMIALIAESNRLYARLALSTAARNRDRDARLMTMDAVAAAISHEVGQPLTAVILNARGGLNSLTSDPPKRDQAIESLQAALDSGHRTFEVMKSARASFAPGAGKTGEVSLNDLVRATVASLHRELADGKVLLQTELDENLPAVLADGVQVQRVIVNLITNAIESLGATRGRHRRLTVRTAVADSRHVLLEVSDSGLGIADEDMTRIFEAFFTTKPAGTGLGLSLSRTIVEEHGGRLWVSRNEGHGATFHLQLPLSHHVTAVQ